MANNNNHSNNNSNNNNNSNINNNQQQQQQTALPCMASQCLAEEDKTIHCPHARMSSTVS
jgi:hypothetical protein